MFLQGLVRGVGDDEIDRLGWNCLQPLDGVQQGDFEHWTAHDNLGGRSDTQGERRRGDSTSGSRSCPLHFSMTRTRSLWRASVTAQVTQDWNESNDSNARTVRTTST